MSAFRKLIPLLIAMAFACELPANAAGAYENQSDVGKNLRLPVHHWFTPNADSRAIIVAVPGLVFTGRAYDLVARELVDSGYEVYSADMRGYGDWRKANGEFDGDSAVHFGQSKDDLTHLLTSLRQKYAGKPIFCLGESFGANMVVWEASTDPTLMDGVIAASLPYKICVHPRPRWFLTFVQGLHHPKKPMDLVPYLVPTLSEDKGVALAALHDDDITLKQLSATDLIKAALTTKNAMKQVRDIPENMPMLVLAGQKDEIQKTNRLPEIMQSMGSHRANLVVLPNKGHLLLERKQLDPGVMKLVHGWLDSQIQRFAKAGTLSSSDPTGKNSDKRAN
jgi:alpha-beta hydrolase superfamily lysophospholipase